MFYATDLQQNAERELTLAVVGARFLNADGSSRWFFIGQCRPGDPIELRPEPTNKHDPHAIAVYNKRGGQLGYLKAERAPWFRAQMACTIVTAIFQEELEWGAVIRVRIGGGEPTIPVARPAPAPIVDYVDREDLAPARYRLDSAYADPDGPEWGA